jgi:hypothetical protein
MNNITLCCNYFNYFMAKTSYYINNCTVIFTVAKNYLVYDGGAYEEIRTTSIITVPTP